MKKLPDNQQPKDVEAWLAEVEEVNRLPQPEEKPTASLIINNIQPSLSMSGVYNPNSFTELTVGNTDNIDKNTAEKFRKGQFKIEARIDLHGRTEKEAFSAVEDFVKNSYICGRRCVLIITGKGIKKDDEAWYEPKGIIREALPKWLNHPEIRPFILCMSPALPIDGGNGAMYVLLKRKRDLNQVEKF